MSGQGYNYDRRCASSMWLGLATDKMYPAVQEWIHRPSSGKAEVFEAYESLRPREKAAYDADVKAAFHKAHGGGSTTGYRYKDRPRHMGGMSLTTTEPTYLSPDKYTAYEVRDDDVLVHWAQEEMPLGGNAFGHEKELILRKDANPRPL
jgi:hypothetical protein